MKPSLFALAAVATSAGFVLATFAASATTTAPATAPATATRAAPAALDTPEAAVHELLLAMLAGDKDRINRCTWPDEGREILVENQPLSGAQRLQLELQYRAMPLTRLKVGDTVKLAGGKSVVMDTSRVNAEIQQLTNADLPFPFSVELDGKDWKVDARPLIASRRAAVAARTRAATQTKPAGTGTTTTIRTATQPL